MTVLGVDISHWNIPPVNLAGMVAQHGINFVIIKGCDGGVNVNYYLEHVQAAKAAGLLWGMYVWLYPHNRVDIDLQVNAWYARAQADPPPLGIFIDAEWTTYNGVPANPVASDLRMAHDKLKAKQGRVAITYTSAGYANAHLQGFDFSREPLWVAHYGVSSPLLPIGASTWEFWQYTNKLYFESKYYDGNYYNGSLEQFQNEYGGVIPPPIGEPMKYKATALTDGTRLRPDHNVNQTYLASYPRNTEFYGDVVFIATAPTVANQSVGDKWLEVKEIKITAGGIIQKAGWVAVTHLGNQVTLLEEIMPPVPVEKDIHVDQIFHTDGTITGKWEYI